MYFIWDIQNNYNYDDMNKDPKHGKNNQGHATADKFAIHQHEKKPKGPAVCNVCKQNSDCGDWNKFYMSCDAGRCVCSKPGSKMPFLIENN